MGLPGVLRPLFNELQKINKEIYMKFHHLTEEDKEIDHLFVDFNGMFYSGYNSLAGISPYNKVLEGQFQNLGKRVIENMIMQETLRLFKKNVLDKFKIKKTLYIAVDGVAPAAKMNQQRQRRWASAYLNKKNTKFDTNAFSPGTKFMKDFDEAIQAWLNENGDEIAPTIYYDSYLTPGEGEHKIMDFLRKQKLEGKSILYGLDADLVMLSLLTPTTQLKLVREEQVVDVDKLKIAVEKAFPLLTEGGDARRDFVLITSMFGCDFFPRVPSLRNTEKVTKLLFAQFENHSTPISSRDGTFDVSAFLSFLSNAFPSSGVKETEEELLMEQKNEEVLFPDLMLEKSENLEEYRKWWYSNLLETTERVNRDAVHTVGGVVKEYLKGIVWMFKYYVKGMHSINQYWFYPYPFAPLLVDLVKAKGRLEYEDISVHKNPALHEPVNPIIQLLSILPPKSSSLILSTNFRKFMGSEALTSYYNQQFETHYIGVSAMWKGVLIIAPANPLMIEQYVQDLIDDRKSGFTSESLSSALKDFLPINPTKYEVGAETFKLREREEHMEKLLASTETQSSGGNQTRGRGRGRGNQTRGRGRAPLTETGKGQSVVMRRGRGRGREKAKEVDFDAL